MDKADTAEALSKAAKLQAIDSEVERIAAELREYGVETKLGVGGLLGHGDQAQVDMYRQTFELLMHEIPDLECEFIPEGPPDLRGAPKSAAGKIVRRGSSLLSSSSIHAWKLIRPSDKKNLYAILKYGLSATFCVCEESALTKKDASSLAVKQIWAAIGFFTPLEVKSMVAAITAAIANPTT